MDNSQKFDAGVEVLRQLFKNEPPKELTSNDYGRTLLIENVFGSLWSRPGLAIEERSLITVAVLTALNRGPELENHLLGAKNLGISAAKIEEVMIHLSVYAGWPAASTGLAAMRKIFADASSE